MFSNDFSHRCDRGVTANTTHTSPLCLGRRLDLSGIMEESERRPDFTQSLQIRRRSEVGNLPSQPRLLGFFTPQANHVRLNKPSRQTFGHM